MYIYYLLEYCEEHRMKQWKEYSSLLKQKKKISLFIYFMNIFALEYLHQKQ